MTEKSTDHRLRGSAPRGRGFQPRVRHPKRLSPIDPTPLSNSLRRWRPLTALIPLLLLSLLPTNAHATDPCEGIAIGDGDVRTARALAVSLPIPAGDLACAGAVGAALAARGGTRSITLVVRLAEGDRAAGVPEKVGAEYTAALAAGGLPAERITTLAPAAAPGTVGTLAITFTERRGRRPVGRIDEAEGAVQAGPDATTLRPAGRGETLLPRSRVETGANGRAWVSLVDGSRVKVLADTHLVLAELRLDENLKRHVRLEITQGEVEAAVKSGGEGARFEIDTGTGVAGVRGTHFRLGKDADGTALETLSGLVELTHEGKTVAVPAGFGVRSGPGQPPGEPAALLGPPPVEGPFQGPLAPTDTLRWAAVGGATGYRIDLARDAEFIYDVRRIDVTTPRLEATALTKLEGGPLPKGKWFWRVSGTGGGFGGQTSKVYAFEWSP